MPLLSVRDLQVDFTTRNGRITAVNGIGFDVEPGQITAIIGESGSGKSVACYSLLGLLPMPPASIERGSAVFDGRDLLQMSERELRKIRGRDIAMIFQDPMTCLNPYMTVGNQLVEPLIYHRKVTRAQARERALELLAEVGLRDPQ
ncbi:MAG TPA: ABC transporter ATP-binding protein, partial [Halieaceae bacterium]|nr:ABC transporter ATP-binding protein [Halieaceae bacterium]